MAFIHFDARYAPGGLLIVRDGASPKSDKPGDTVLVRSDWDFPSVASAIGLVPCSECYETDGTIDCAHHTTTDMISAAYAYLREHAGESFPALDDYLSDRA